MKVVLVLIGFPGAGKTSVGRLLREQGWSWVDLDQEIERRAGKVVTEIIRVEGEIKFRLLEEKVLSELLSSSKANLISIGGGALSAPGTKAVLEKSKAWLVNLAVSDETASRRLFQDELASDLKSLRPILTEHGAGSDLESMQKAVSSLRAKRQGLYTAKLNLWTDWVQTERVALELQEEVEIGELDVWRSVLPYPNTSEPKSPLVVVGSGLRNQLALRVRRRFKGALKVALVIDSEVDVHWGNELAVALGEGGLEVIKLPVPRGEASKDMQLILNFTDVMLAKGFSRKDLVIACGGGVVGDLAGFLASIYMRGVGLVHVPTTVVAQADSAIGGKTTVNRPAAKNVLGTFYPAGITISDVDFLRTLPEREYISGLAEVVKYGCIASEDFFRWLEINLRQILKREETALTEIIEFSSRTKLDFVVGDIKDLAGRRVLLNFGHTVGHAVESLTGYGKYLHGEAIAIGMVVALALGEKVLGRSIELRSRVSKLLEQIGLPTTLPAELLVGAKEFSSVVSKLEGSDGNLDESKLISVQDAETKLASGFYQRWLGALRADKKRISDEVDFVFVGPLGQAETARVGLATVVKCVAAHTSI